MTRRIDDGSNKVREAIYDLATSGKEFTGFEVAERAGLISADVTVFNALRAAWLVGILERTSTTKRHRPQSREDFVGGAAPVKRRVFLYRGTPRVRQNAEAQ